VRINKKIKITRQVTMTIDKEKLKRAAIPVGIVLFGALVMGALIMLKSAPEKQAPSNAGVLVRTTEVMLDDWQVTVSGTATVSAASSVSIMPQVSGEIREVSRNFVDGGFVRKGEMLFRIDNADYRLALKIAESAEAQAEVEYETIKSRAAIARREWKIISESMGQAGSQDTAAPNPLVLYGPQLKNVEATMQSAAAKVEQARLNLKRTVVRAPFAGRVRQKTVDLGQYVRAGGPVAALAGTATAEVVMPLRRGELDWIRIPGSEAAITVPGHGTGASWTGRVSRSLGEVDMKSRMVQVVVEVDDPYGLKKGAGTGPQLMNGSFVNINISGRTLRSVAVFPRAALRDNNTVWIMDREGLLRVRDVHVVRMEGDSVIADRGLRDGDIIVLSSVSGAADGMKLRDADAAPDVIANSPSPVSNSAGNADSPAPLEQLR
jgi:RND family efflux transporter MFP subunit